MSASSLMSLKSLASLTSLKSLDAGYKNVTHVHVVILSETKDLSGSTTIDRLGDLEIFRFRSR